MKKTRQTGKNATPVRPTNQPGADASGLAATVESQEKETTLEVWRLRLYVAGRTSRSVAAQTNLKKIGEEFLPERYSLEVIDLLENPSLAREDQIIAVPTLIRIFPEPARRIIGDLSHTTKVLDSLDLHLLSVPKLTSNQGNSEKL